MATLHPILRLLSRTDRSELCDNRMTLFAPGFGLGSVHYWDGSWDNDEDENPRQLREIFENRDGQLEIVSDDRADLLQQDRRQWWPHAMETLFVGARQTVWQETKAIHDDTAVDLIRCKGGGLKPSRAVVRQRLEKRPGLTIRPMPFGVHVLATQGQYAGVHRFIGFRGGAVKVKVIQQGEAVVVEAHLSLAPEQWQELVFVVAADERGELARQRCLSALQAPQRFLDGARQGWERFFDEHVPTLECDHALWTELYYHSAYVLRANLYDFKKGAIRHPYSCPSKMKFLPSWFWDPCFHGFAEKWFRDYPAPVSTFFNHFEAQEEDGYLPMTVDCRGNTWKALGVAAKACQQFLHPLTLWDHYLVHGDRRVLRRALPHLMAHDRYLQQHREPGPGPMFVPLSGGELADNSSRLVADTAKRDEIGTLGQRIEPVDWNSYLYASQRTMSRMATEIGDLAAARTMTARAEARLGPLRRLWNARTGLFTDRLLPQRILSSKRFPEGLIPLLAGFPTKKQAGMMTRFLLDPKQLWSVFPVPTLPLSDPCFNTSDTYASYWNGRVWPPINWCIIEGLCRAGLRTAGRRLLERTLETHVFTGRPWCMENFHPLESRRYAPTYSGFNQGWGAVCLDLILRRGLGLQLNAPAGNLYWQPLGLPCVREARVSGVPFGSDTLDVWIDLRKPSAKVRGSKRVRVTHRHIHWLQL